METRDEKLNVKNLLEGAKELKSENKQNDGEEETTKIIGQNWFENAKTGETKEGNTPVIPKDGVNLSTEEYNGPGIVLSKEEAVEKTTTPPKYTGINPETVDLVSDYLKDMDERTEAAKQKTEEIKKQVTTDTDEDSDEEQTEGMSKDEFDQKYSEAVVFIDKTGMGSVINFTDEEREKLEKVKKIKLEEIETIEIKTLKTKKINKKGGLDKILKRQPSVHTTHVVLTASGYTAVIQGCSTYELIALMSDTQNMLIDTEGKWSLIHSKIVETSIGKMDFNEFLQHTASVDYNTFIYGLLCATYPDDDKIPLKCESDNCKKEFEHHYSIKSLIRAEKISDILKDRVSTIVDASHTEETAKKMHSEAPVNELKRIVLPVTGIYVDMYVQSAYDFIYKSIKSLSDNKDVKYNQASVLSTVVKSLYIPDPDEEGSFFEVDEAMDVAKVIYSLGDTDILVLTKQSDQMLDDLNFEFGLMDITCPHCKHHTNHMPIDLESILFYKYQQAMNTKIE